ncbi:MAG: hypothetical protein C4560_01340 [Nitrospiraceae bacterium]|nr:MAG: hypothetical protein C4560_01340 [Nitrospiraceae bacterium]
MRLIKDDYIQLENIETGEQIVIERRMTRYRRIGMGLLNSLKIDKGFVKHIILTQKEEMYQPKHLNYFMSALRRKYGKIRYLWTAETQERGVLHWHMICAFDWETEFGKDDVVAIQRFWKFGQLEIVPVRKPNIEYLLKYITKALDTVVEGVRRIGSSRFPGYLKQSWKRVVKVFEHFIDCGYPKWDEFYWQNGRAYAKRVDDDGRILEKILIYRPPKEWEFVNSFSELPF